MFRHLFTLGLTTCLCEKTGGGEVIWTQTRPAIEFVSGEEGLRPKSYFTVFFFVEYTLVHALKYVIAPGSCCGAEGDGGTAPLAATVLSACQAGSLARSAQSDANNEIHKPDDSGCLVRVFLLGR